MPDETPRRSPGIAPPRKTPPQPSAAEPSRPESPDAAPQWPDVVAKAKAAAQADELAYWSRWWDGFSVFFAVMVSVLLVASATAMGSGAGTSAVVYFTGSAIAMAVWALASRTVAAVLRWLSAYGKRTQASSRSK